MRNQEWDPALSELNTLDLAKLVLGLLGLDTVDGETALGVVDETEVLASLLERDDIHETSGVGRVSADLAVDLDQTLHQDGLDLTTVQGVLETRNKREPSVDLFQFDFLQYRYQAGFVPVADEDNQGKAVPELVRTGGGLGGIGSGHLVQEPVRGRTKALLVLLAIKSSPSVTILISNTRTAGIKGDSHFHAINFSLRICLCNSQRIE